MTLFSFFLGAAFVSVFTGTLRPAEAQLELPDPRIVIVGPTGSGKSSLANALLGCDPRSNDCTFNVCDGLDSCTKDTSLGTGLWLGTGQNFTVVDTPGFGDSDGQDEKLIEEMMEVLDGSLGYTNIILLLFDGTTARFTTGLHNMLRQMSSIFGESWWNFMIVGVSKWKYSQEAIDDRQETCEYYPDNCKDEAWFMAEINGQLQEKFHLERNFTFAFIDSWSQTAPELHDEVQQEHYQAEAKILWDSATTRNSTFDFKTIDDVLEENKILKEEVKRLNDIIETNITTLFSLVHTNEERIEGNEGRIVVNEGRIEGSEKRIEIHETNITTNKEKTILNEISINNNKEILEDIVIDVENLRSAPIGTIIAWVSKPTTEASEFVDIPDGWQRCDGSIIHHQSIWAGQRTPDLNNGKRFLRGAHDSDMLTMEEDQLQDHEHISHDPGHAHGYKDYIVGGPPGFGPCCSDHDEDRYNSDAIRTSDSSSTGITVGKVTSSYRRGGETRPANMNVIFIIRIY